MSKVIKIVALVAVAAAIIVFAAPIAGALASAGAALGIGAGVASAALVSSIVGIGISLGLSAAMSVFVKAPKGVTQSLVDRLNSSIVPSAPRKIVFGRTAAGNDVRFFETHGNKKDQYAQVIALASHRVHAIKTFTIEDELSWQGYLTGKYAAGITVFRAITEGNAANAASLGSGSYWNSASKFTGCAYLAINWKLDSKIFTQGIPSRNVTVVEGCPLYDPRRDSSRGGSGAHRSTDQTTWSFYDGSVELGRNPALALLTYLIGYRINGKLVWGMGVPIERINLDNFKIYANVCEERVSRLDGSTVQRYTVDGVLSTSDTHETAISSISAAMGSCKLTDAGGRYTLVGGYDDTMGPKVSFTESDIVAPSGSASPYNWTPAPSVRDTFNIARGRFADPAQGYSLVDWGVIETDPLPDLVPRTMTIDLGFVSSAEACQRIAKQFLLREAKTPGMFAATFGPKAFASEVGSLVTLSLVAQGWNNKLFRVIEQAENHDLLFTMTLREESPEVYAWDREEKPLPASIRPPGYNPLDTISPANLMLTSNSFGGANGINVSEVRVAWTPETSLRVRGIQIESRLVGNTAWTEEASLHDAVAGEFRFASNAPGVSVEVRVRYRMDTGVYSPWVSATINTAAVTISYGDILETPKSLNDISPNEYNNFTRTTANFDTRNDRIATIPVAPTYVGNGITSTLNNDGSADLTTTWDWSGDMDDIDGFRVRVIRVE